MMADQHPFEYQQPSAAGVEKIEKIRQACKELHAVLIWTLPHCRERSLAITKLEEVSMWANKGVVFNEEVETNG
jgi:flavorubredoxin